MNEKVSAGVLRAQAKVNLEIQQQRSQILAHDIAKTQAVFDLRMAIVRECATKMVSGLTIEHAPPDEQWELATQRIAKQAVKLGNAVVDELTADAERTEAAQQAEAEEAAVKAAQAAAEEGTPLAAGTGG